jgi:hypothetical protein
VISADIEILKDIEQRFIAETETKPLAVRREAAGLEQFVSIVVGRDAPIYREALSEINEQLGPNHPFYGRITLLAEKIGNVIDSPEVDALRSLIGRSLVVSPATARSAKHVTFARFVGRQDLELVQRANHVIIGRRGVGKSTLILTTIELLSRRGDKTTWIDMQRYHRRRDMAATAAVLDELLTAFAPIGAPRSELQYRLKLLSSKTDTNEEDVRRVVPTLVAFVRQHLHRQQWYIFLDDFHLVGTELQPVLLDILYSVARGSNVWLKVAFVRNLAIIWDPARQVGLNIPQDAQSVELDQTLADPVSARAHLTAVLDTFVERCGFKHVGNLLNSEALERLVWCSAGVPRDCLSLFSSALRIAKDHRRRKVGVQEINLAAGELAGLKTNQLAVETTGEDAPLLELLDEIQRFCLDERHKNAFLVSKQPLNPRYQLFAKLVDLRFVHLVHPSITADKAGVRYEAYLLDYSFYTGMRRRQNIEELRIEGSRPKREELRRLPKFNL